MAIWDWERREVVETIETTADNAAAFDPSGTRLVTSSDTEGVAEVWDVQTREREVVATLGGSSFGATFSPDGSTIATAGGDATVRLWDAQSGEQILVLRGHENLVSSVAFSPDGSQLASGSADGTVRVWALDLDDLVDIAERELTRDLTDAECRQYMHVDRCPEG